MSLTNETEKISIFKAPAPDELSKIRLILMRVLFLLTSLLAFQMWPLMIAPEELIEPLEGVAYSFWTAYSTLAILGIIYPIKMLPLLVLQFFYKSVWVLAIAIPLWSSGNMEILDSELFNNMLIGSVLDLIIIPWPYFIKTYFKK